jgi:hypothetical protein
VSRKKHKKRAHKRAIKKNFLKKILKLRGTKKRKSRKTFSPVLSKNEPIIIKEGASMAGRKRKRKSHKLHGAAKRSHRRKRSHRMHGENLPAVMHGGRKRRRHSRRRFFGADSSPKARPVQLIIDSGIAAGGAVAGTMLAKMIPLPEKIRPAIPLAAAIGIAMFAPKIPFARQITTGLGVVGVYGLLKAFIPTLPMLSGEDVVYLPMRGDEVMGDELSGTVTSFAPDVAGDEFMGVDSIGPENVN